MKIGIIDADLVGRIKHRFPNLVCMKLSNYNKRLGHSVELLTNYDTIENYDKVYISKVFTDTPVPEAVLNLSWVKYGGTGFYFDKAPNLNPEIEHSMPDYHLYDDFINSLVESGAKKSEFKEYSDYSIGFLTRGCFRKCGFCINKKYDHVFKHSPLDEFYDPERKKICMLDDNFLGCPNWREMLQELIDTGKPFKFKQGLDERLLTDEKCEILFNCKYDGDFTFAFDKIEDYRLVEKKLKLIRSHTDKTNIKFYVLCGWDSTDIQDIINTFERIKLLQSYKCLPYIMRFRSKDGAPWESSEFRGMYIALSSWCNQPAIFKKNTFYQFCEAKLRDGNKACMRYATEFMEKYPDIANEFFYIKWGEVS